MGSRLPAVDERLVAPEAHAEIIDGRVVRAPGSTEARGTLHAEASRLLAAVVAEGYAGALSMLTRTDALTDIAPDVSVFARGEDPETGGRWLEEIALEVIDAGRLSYATLKVEKLAARGGAAAVLREGRDAAGVRVVSRARRLGDAQRRRGDRRSVLPRADPGEGAGRPRARG
ncbi:MAG: hypothetical protein R3A52_22295 [Polyangiales bacterium]